MTEPETSSEKVEVAPDRPPNRVKAFDDEASVLVIVGGARHPLRDVYHFLVRTPWWGAVAVICAVVLLANLLFASVFALIGGIHGARPGSFVDAFFFSVQTLSTVGYGAMYPESTLASSVMAVELMAGVVLTAVATGLIFTKFSTPRPRVFFAQYAVITPYDGVPTLMVRIGNDRGDHIVDARMRMALTRTERTKEGLTYYRSRDLALVREHHASFRRGSTLMHRIDETSPLFGATPASLKATDSEVIVSLVGIDATTSQIVHAGGSYLDDEIRFGHRYADTIRELPDGRYELDARRFHDTVPSEPIEGFPYPRAK